MTERRRPTRDPRIVRIDSQTLLRLPALPFTPEWHAANRPPAPAGSRFAPQEDAHDSGNRRPVALPE